MLEVPGSIPHGGIVERCSLGMKNHLYSNLRFTLSLGQIILTYRKSLAIVMLNGSASCIDLGTS